MDAAAPTTVVFLHIPKTAGQTIHAELTRAMGKDTVSPVRVHTQAGPGTAQMPPGYRLYSGHLDWEALETLPEPRFAFTVLRDPLERLASFYFFILRKAQALAPADLALPQNTGMRMALENSADDYFFGGDEGWQKFIKDHYHTPYCSYLVTRRIRGWNQASRLPPEVLLRRAVRAAKGLSGVYSVDRLDRLETDVKQRLGFDISVADRFVNAAPEGTSEKRWPRLLERLERPDTGDRLQDFANLDLQLMDELNLGSNF